MGRCGGISQADPNDQHTVGVFKQAIAQHNAQAHDSLQFVRLREVTKQVVRGLNLCGKAECLKNGETVVYQLKIWAKPSNEPIEVQQFERI
jgi:hypothetical protein